MIRVKVKGKDEESKLRRAVIVLGWDEDEQIFTNQTMDKQPKDQILKDMAEAEHKARVNSVHKALEEGLAAVDAKSADEKE